MLAVVKGQFLWMCECVRGDKRREGGRANEKIKGRRRAVYREEKRVAGRRIEKERGGITWVGAIGRGGE